MRRLDGILADFLPPGQEVDFLNVDAEGLDHEVLASNDWSRCRPTAIAVETHGFDLARPAASPTYRLLHELGYRLLSHVVVTSIYRLA